MLLEWRRKCFVNCMKIIAGGWHAAQRPQQEYIWIAHSHLLLASPSVAWTLNNGEVLLFFNFPGLLLLRGAYRLKERRALSSDIGYLCHVPYSTHIWDWFHCVRSCCIRHVDAFTRYNHLDFAFLFAHSHAQISEAKSPPMYFFAFVYLTFSWGFCIFQLLLSRKVAIYSLASPFNAL